MKDLYVLTADIDAFVVMETILERYQSLGIRPITFDVDRYYTHDSGMVQTGPEYARTKKGKYKKALLMWDFHGSGKELRETPEVMVKKIQARLDMVSWKDNSGAVVLVPELEEWLWHNEASMCAHLGISNGNLDLWIKEFAIKHDIPIHSARYDKPKELLEYICHSKIKKTFVSNDFNKIAKIASLKAWRDSQSFREVVNILQTWFPSN